MLSIVIKEKMGDIVNNLIYIMLVTLNMSVVFLLSEAGKLLKKIHNSKWFSEEIYLQSMQDTFFAEKFKMVYNAALIFVLISQVILSIILLYIIINHINKWKLDAALLYTLGYSDKKLFAYFFERNFVDTVCSSLAGVVLTAVIWKAFIINKLLNSVINISGVGNEMNYWKFLIISVCIFAVQMTISIITCKKQKKKNIRNVTDA